MPQKREEFIAVCDAKLRLVRAEADLTQEQMAYAVGLSKKTLVDIEKGRRSLGWSGAVTLCAVFASSSVLGDTFGGSPVEVVPHLAHTGASHHELPGGPWWEVIATNDDFILEQNTISLHYRLLTKDRAKVGASFDIDDLMPAFRGHVKE